jgi:DNA-binding FadR family transcriptional regulator
MPVVLNRISKTNVVDTVIGQMVDLLLSGKLKVGEKLPAETELAAQVGVGRNSIREAMKVLQVLGIVERRQGDGSYIREAMDIPLETFLFPLISRIKNAEELLELREMLELGVLDLVLTRATEKDFSTLEEKINILEEYAYKEPYPKEEAIKADMAFHTSIIEITQNQAIIQLGTLIMRMFQSAMGEHIATKKGILQAIQAHRAILQAMRNRDIDRAKQEVVQSLIVWKGYVKLNPN